MPRKSKNPITASDWIVFLQGEISSTLSFMIPFFTTLILVYISIVQMNQIIRSEIFPYKLEDIFIATMFILSVFIFIVGREINPLKKLSKQIISGEITSQEEILKEYKKIKNIKYKYFTIKKNKTKS